ncbi:MAG: hypothetical protein U5N85_07280 [Arcicella sp.]|nr:hypothetical protein [Arcicella sp.]
MNDIITIQKRFNDFGNKRVKVILSDEEDPYQSAKESLSTANKIAKDTGLDQMTMEEINAEIRAVRDGK